MKGKTNLFFVAAAAVAALLAPQVAWASYTQIQHNLVDGAPDTSLSSTGLLTIHSTSTRLSLFDDSVVGGLLPGTASNVTADLSTQLASYNPLTGEALFTQGNYMLTFDWDGSSYAIGGPIAGIVLSVAETGTISRINGEGLFTATTKNLPGPDGNAGNWPATGYSSIRSLSLAFNQDLSTFQWDQALTGRIETQYTLFPKEVAAPEPASIALMLVGSALLARRRRK